MYQLKSKDEINVKRYLSVLLTHRRIRPIPSLILEFDCMVGFYARLNIKLVCFVRKFSMSIAKSACLKCLSIFRLIGCCCNMDYAYGKWNIKTCLEKSIYPC